MYLFGCLFHFNMPIFIQQEHIEFIRSDSQNIRLLKKTKNSNKIQYIAVSQKLDHVTLKNGVMMQKFGIIFKTLKLWKLITIINYYYYLLLYQDHQKIKSWS